MTAESALRSQICVELSVDVCGGLDFILFCLIADTYNWERVSAESAFWSQIGAELRLDFCGGFGSGNMYVWDFGSGVFWAT